MTAADKRRPGERRDAVLRAFRTLGERLSVEQIRPRVDMDLAALRSSVANLRTLGYLKTLARSRGFTAYGLTEHGCRAWLALHAPAEAEAEAPAVPVREQRGRLLELLAVRSMTSAEVAAQLGTTVGRAAVLIGHARRLGHVCDGEPQPGNGARQLSAFMLSPAVRRMLDAAPAEAVATAPALPPAPPEPVVPSSTVNRLGGLAEPDRPQATRPGALDFVQCFSRRGDVLVPMSEIHNRGI